MGVARGSGPEDLTSDLLSDTSTGHPISAPGLCALVISQPGKVDDNGFGGEKREPMKRARMECICLFVLYSLTS